MTTAEQIGPRLDELWERVAAAGGDPATVTLVAVTKGFGPEVAVVAADAGLCDLGENYAQELTAKAPILAERTPTVRWHAIGRLQRNKVRQIAPFVHLWQSVDRPELATEVARRAPGASILIQVNVTDEPAKGGCDPTGVDELVGHARHAGLEVLGLMTVGRTGEAAEARPGFKQLSVLADRHDLAVRSMGMSGDLEVAVSEGSTMIRVGSALFGPRPSVRWSDGPDR